MAGQHTLVGRLALRALSLLVGVILALVVTEGILRLFSLAPTDGVATVTEAEFRSVPGLLSPNQELIDRRKRALPHHVHINDLGYRGAPLTREKPPREIRILMVGDSFTYGDFVNDDETLPAQLERELGRDCPGVRAINAGVGGTTIDTHARLVERALSLGPDLVILTFSENDLHDLAAEPSAWDRFAANRAIKSRPPLSIVYPVLRRLAFWNFALETRAKLKARSAEGDADAGPAGEANAETEGDAGMRLLPVYVNALTALRDRLEAEGVAFILALFPSHLSLPKEASILRLERLERAGGESGIPTVNLLEPLRRSGEAIEHLYLLPHDGHPSQHGYAVAAAALAVEIGRGKWLSASCGQANPVSVR